jgi:hypothetical protein
MGIIRSEFPSRLPSVYNSRTGAMNGHDRVTACSVACGGANLSERLLEVRQQFRSENGKGCRPVAQETVVEIAQRRASARFTPVFREQSFQLRATGRIGNHASWPQRDSGDGCLGLFHRKAGLVCEEFNPLLDTPRAAG